MERLGYLLKQQEFHVLLFVICLVLFGWPVVSYPDIARLKAMFIYLFVSWACIIFVQFLVGRYLDVTESPNQVDDEGEQE